MSSEKRITFTASKTYSTLNDFGPETKNIWLVFHGMGHLSRYFIKHFSALNNRENYIIAPQAPSKYYQGSEYRHVGASWLTREDTVEENKNVLNYVDAVWQAEKPAGRFKLIVLGYSQGVSIACRWLASRQMNCDLLILHSGGIPKELTSSDFTHFHDDTKVEFWYGDKDEFITDERISEEKIKGNELFGQRLELVVFNGVHEVYTPFINKIVRNI